MIYHCMFEQSGTFKNEFKKMGYTAYDYDILNDFGETDYIIDLFAEIEKAYNGDKSVFDIISQEDMILAFFPCIRFENQCYMIFRGEQRQLINKTDREKLEIDIKYHRELSQLYELITKLVIVCIDKKLKLMIENPYSELHYLTRYWAIKPKVIDRDRTMRGDFYKKPTQYWFINCEPHHNFIVKPQVVQKTNKLIICITDKAERSMISKEYANNFIQEFILDGQEMEKLEELTLFDLV